MPNNKSSLSNALLASPLESYILEIILCMTPILVTLAGGLIQIGNLNVNVAISIGLSVPIGIERDDQLTPVSSTVVRLVQSM